MEYAASRTRTARHYPLWWVVQGAIIYFFNFGGNVPDHWVLKNFTNVVTP